MVVRLNGGRNRLGLDGPGSLLEVQRNMSLIDIAIAQIEHLNETYDADIPLVIMNSFETDKRTIEWVESKPGRRKVRILMFTQRRTPALYSNTLEPVPNQFHTAGHGDVFESLYNQRKPSRVLRMCFACASHVLRMCFACASHVCFACG